MARLDAPPTRAISLPLDKAYRLIDLGDSYTSGDYIRTNWLGAFYKLGAAGVPTDHTGDDVVQYRSVIKGDPLYAICDGYINYSFDVGPVNWGWLVTLDFSLPIDIIVTELNRANLSKYIRTVLPARMPLTARYAHMDAVIVKAGQFVHAGQKIGTVGDAHGLFAPHLHFDLCYTDILDTWPREWPGLDLATIALNYFAPGETLRDYAGWRAEPMSVVKKVIVPGIEAHKTFYLSSPVMRIYPTGTEIEVDDTSGVLDPETGVTMVQTPVDNWVPAALVGLPEIAPAPPPPPPADNVKYVNTPGDVLLLRKDGNINGAVLAKLAHKTKVTILVTANSNGYDLVSVSVNGQDMSGYVADRFLSATLP